MFEGSTDLSRKLDKIVKVKQEDYWCFCLLLGFGGYNYADSLGCECIYVPKGQLFIFSNFVQKLSSIVRGHE